MAEPVCFLKGRWLSLSPSGQEERERGGGGKEAEVQMEIWPGRMFSHLAEKLTGSGGGAAVAWSQTPTEDLQVDEGQVWIFWSPYISAVSNHLDYMLSHWSLLKNLLQKLSLYLLLLLLCHVLWCISV